MLHECDQVFSVGFGMFQWKYWQPVAGSGGELEVEGDGGGSGGVGHHDLAPLHQSKLGKGEFQVLPRGLLDAGH